MLTELQNLVNRIEDAQKDLNTIEVKVNELDLDRLKQVIGIAMKGLKFDKIYSKWDSFGYDSFNRKDDDYEYFQEKGIWLDYKRLYTKEGTFNSLYKERDLFLLSDGTFKVYYKVSEISHEQGHTSQYTREVSKYQELEQFDIDAMIKSIMENLGDRLENLGKRTKTQKERLEKIEGLKI